MGPSGKSRTGRGRSHDDTTPVVIVVKKNAASGSQDATDRHNDEASPLDVLTKLTPGLDPTKLSVSPLTRPSSESTQEITVFSASEDDQIIRRGLDKLQFTLPLHSPLLRPRGSIALVLDPTHEEERLASPISGTVTRAQLEFSGQLGESLFRPWDRVLQTPLGAGGAGGDSGPAAPPPPTIHSPYVRMCTELENFVDEESQATDTLLINRPSGPSSTPHLTPELLKASLSSHSLSGQHRSSSAGGTGKYPLEMNVSRSLWLGNMDPTITEAEVHAVFAPFGDIETIRLLPAKECAFVNFYAMEDAMRARNAMQGKPLGNLLLRIGYGKIDVAVPSGHNPNATAHEHSRSIWIGNVGPEVTGELLMSHFNTFGPIESCRVLESRGCAFVNFYSQEAAAAARVAMNGAIIADSIIKTGYAKDGTGEMNANACGFMPMGAFVPAIAPFALPMSQGYAPLDQLSDPILAVMQRQHGGGGAVPHLPTRNTDATALDGVLLRDYRRAVETNPQEIPAILDSLLPDLMDVCVDAYGNILMQKIIERAEEGDQQQILERLGRRLPQVAMNKNGTWVVQKLISCGRSAAVVKGVIVALREHIVPLLEDQYGNYVVQCLMGVEDREDGANGGESTLISSGSFVVDVIVDNCRRLATGRFSSRALRSILDSASAAHQRLIAQAVGREAVLLSVDANGAVVIQWLLDSELPGKLSLVAGQLQGRLAQVALTKQGSAIVARIVASSDESAARDAAILELYEIVGQGGVDVSAGFESRLEAMLQEPTTCSILLKAYHMSRPAIRIRLAHKLIPHLIRVLVAVTGERDESVFRVPNHPIMERIPVHLARLHGELLLNGASRM